MCNQSRGQGAYGSSQGFQPQQMQSPSTYTPNTQNPTLNNGMQYGMRQMRLMPGFQSGNPGQFGMAGSQGIKYMPRPNDPFSMGDPAQPWTPADPNAPPIMMDRGVPNLASPFQEPQAVFNGPQKSVGFSVGQTKPLALPTEQPMPTQTNPLAPAQPTQAQNLTQMANQAVMGPFGNMYNRPGDSRGGYFQNGQYTPHVGNAMTGLDNLARWGFGPDGQPLQRGPFLR